MNREIIATALFNLLTGPPLVVPFTADTTTGSATLTAVSGTTGLMEGMPIAGDGVPLGATIATITPAVTLSLPAIADRTAAALLQGFQTASRRLAEPAAEQDMPSLYLIDANEVHPGRQSGGSTLIELGYEAWIYTKAGAEENAIPAQALNVLIDAIERAIYPVPTRFRQTLGVNGVHYTRIEGELQKDPGHSAQLAMAMVPIRVAVALMADTYLLP